MLLLTWVLAYFAYIIPRLTYSVRSGKRVSDFEWDAVAAFWQFIGAIIAVYGGYVPYLYIIFGSYFAWKAWKNRPRGKWKKVKKAIGAKTKALRDRIVAAMPKSSPVQVPA